MTCLFVSSVSREKAPLQMGCGDTVMKGDKRTDTCTYGACKCVWWRVGVKTLASVCGSVRNAGHTYANACEQREEEEKRVGACRGGGWAGVGVAWAAVFGSAV